MKEFSFPALFFFVILLLLSSCRTVIDPVRPGEYYEPADARPPLSTINVPIDLDISKFEKIFNTEYKGLIYADTSFTDNENDGLKLKAYKQGNVTFQMQGSQLSYVVPLYISLEKKFSVGAFGYSVSDTREATATIRLKFRTSLSVGTDWSLSSRTVSEGYEWVTTPSLKLGSLSVPLPVISDMLLEENLPVISKEIDLAIRSSLDLRTMASDLWKSIQEPVRISEDPPLWVAINPVEASTVPIRGAGSLLRQTVGILVEAELVYGGRPDRSPNPALPPLKITSRIDEGFGVSLRTRLPFTELNGEANRQLAGKTFSQGKYTIRIEDVTLFGNGRKLIVAAKVSGSIDGVVFLAGEPWYDTLTATVRVRNIDFDVQTKNALVRSASWLLHGNVTARIAEMLTFPAGDLMDQARAELKSYLAQDQSFGYFTLGGSLERMEIGRIMITPASVDILFLFDGTLSLGLNVD